MDSVIDKKIKVPLHYQIYLDLLKKIQNGLLKPGERIPSEPELERIYDGAEYFHPVLQAFFTDQLLQPVHKVQIAVFTQQDFYQVGIFIYKGVDFIENHGWPLLQIHGIVL